MLLTSAMIGRSAGFVMLAGLALGCGTKPPPQSASSSEPHPTVADYSGTYRYPLGNEFLPIGRALSRNQVTDCTSFAIEPNANNPHEFKIRCTTDGRTFVHYLVRTDVNTMTRLAADGSLPSQQ
jgi:hypothetical protein